MLASAPENLPVNSRLIPLRPTCIVLALAGPLAGCSSIEGLLAGDKIDYRGSASAKAKPLEVPPDLTQLARDPRFAPQGGVVSAAAVPQGPSTTSGSAALASVAPTTVGKVRIERQGQHRWIVAEAPPEVVYPEVRAFWQERGIALTTDKPDVGQMETDWLENRAKLPNDIIRSTLGRLVDRLYDSGERDRFRVRIERAGSGSEIFLTHRGLEEVYLTEQKDSTAWRPRDNDPALEAELLTRLLVRLGTREEGAKAMVATAQEAPARARALADATSLEVDEPFDRAWRRVGLALDRGGFTVEDRDRSAGLYFVRHIDPKAVAAEEPGFFAKLFGAKGPDKTPQRYRVALKAAGDKTTVVVLSSAGAPSPGDTARTIVAQLVRELR